MNEDYKWKVVPLSKGQLLDVNPNDIIANGHFRKCNTYKGGGGYDHFPILSKKYFGKEHNLQFVVQLFGCNLDCPYCYVTREGVWSKYVEYNSNSIVKIFNNTTCSVLHLMGGAPALYLSYWSYLIDSLQNYGKSEWIFHSDLMLSESSYNETTLKKISIKNALYAVNIKGTTEEEYFKNTRKKFKEKLLWDNLNKLETNSVPYYFTFTGIEKSSINLFWDKYLKFFGSSCFDNRYSDAFSISLIKYNATAFVDSIPWGKNNLSIS